MTLPRTRYRTGDDALDQELVELIARSGIDDDHDLVFELLVSALRLGRESVDRGDLKLVNAALKELRYSFRVFERYRDARKITLFGSARTKPDHPAYKAAHDFGAAMAAQGWMVLTGAGPGIMTAGMEGAGREHSFGINIVLPFEQRANHVIDGDPKLINFRYFFTRKLALVKESHAFAVFPGGFGTMDEAFELLTLMQTGKTFLAPVILVDEPGGNFWAKWRHFIQDELLHDGYISQRDMSLIHITDDIDAAVAETCRFYTTYHSMRWVGSRLIVRLARELSVGEVAGLNVEFADIIESGEIEPCPPTQSEIDDVDFVDLPRIAFRFDRAGYARLRELIDRLNTPPVVG